MARTCDGAIEYYRATLRVWTEADFPQDWALVQNNLGNACGQLPTGDRAENLRKASECYQAALRVWTEADSPYYWASVQDILGNAYRDLPTANRRENLEKAIACYQAALRVHTEEMFPGDWADIQNNMALAFLELADVTGGASYRHTAREHFVAAVRGFGSVGLKQEAADTESRIADLDRAEEGAAASALTPLAP
ncbi:MAG: hypothetical protein ACT4PY_12850 [Armatimonadota bacterium]